jgi:hypothetical protein
MMPRDDTDSSTAPSLRDAARELDDAGLCVLKIKADGTKKPALAWLQYKATRSTPAEHDQWYSGDRTAGIAVVYGAVSGNVELLEVEGHAVRDGILDELTEIMDASGLGEPWHAILTGWTSESPSGGWHGRVRIEGGDVPGNTKLASRLARENEYTAEERQRLREKPNAKIIRVQIETRGEGGYGIVEPSGGSVHPSGKPYVRLAGGPASIPTIDADTMDAIRDVCRMLDTLPSEKKAKTAPRPKRELPPGAVRPGDDFENRADWTEIIGDEFDPVYTRGRTTYWRRKGKNRGISATTGHAEDRDRLYVFSTSTVFEAEVPYDKFAAYTLLTQGSTTHDAFRQAAAELRGRGFGSSPSTATPRPRTYMHPAKRLRALVTKVAGASGDDAAGLLQWAARNGFAAGREAKVEPKVVADAFRKAAVRAGLDNDLAMTIIRASYREGAK